MNAKSIQILRGSTTYDPLTSEEILLDGQPFYSKKTKQFYVGDGVTPIKNLKSINVTSLEEGSGKNSLNQVQDGTTGTFDFTGKNTNATSYDSTLTGQIAYGGVGNFSTALGGKSSAQGKRSLAVGSTTIAKGASSLASGVNSVSLGEASFSAGNQTTSKGLSSASFGSGTQALKDRAFSIGNNTIAAGDSSLASGYNSEANGDYSSSFGNTNITGGESSFATGKNNTLSGIAAFSTGANNTSEADYSVIEGSNNVIKVSLPESGGGGGGTPSSPADYRTRYGEASHVEGGNNYNYGYCNHMEGFNNIAYGLGCHVSGNNNTVGHVVDNKLQGVGAFATGYKTQALHDYSATFGSGTVTSRNNQLAVGTYNDTTINNNAWLFAVGNGIEGFPSNALTVLNDGRVKIKTAPKDDNDAVRKSDINNLINHLYEHTYKSSVWTIVIVSPSPTQLSSGLSVASMWLNNGGFQTAVLVRGTYTNVDDDNKPYVIVGATPARNAAYINLALIGPSSTRYIELTNFTYTKHTMRQLM